MTPSVRLRGGSNRSSRNARALRLVAGVVPLAFASLAAFVACGEEAPVTPAEDASFAPDQDAQGGALDAGTEDRIVPRGARRLGIQVDLGDVELLRRVRAARSAHASTTTVSFGWDEVEVPYDAGADAADAASTALFQPALHIANLVLSSEGVGMILSLDAFDASGSRAPADLRSAALDDAALLARYDALEDYAFSQLGDVRVDALLVASDAERLLAASPTAPAAFGRFLAHVRAHTRTLAPDVKVGFTVPLRAASEAREAIAEGWKESDLVALDITAVDDAARAVDPAIVATELTRTLAGLPAKPVVLRAVGYPSATEVGGSREDQARFVREAFAIWDAHPAQIPVLVFRELDDAPGAVVTERAQRQGRNDEAFRQVVGSLGLRDGSGVPKPAYDEVTRQASIRGF